MQRSGHSRRCLACTLSREQATAQSGTDSDNSATNKVFVVQLALSGGALHSLHPLACTPQASADSDSNSRTTAGGLLDILLERSNGSLLYALLALQLLPSFETTFESKFESGARLQLGKAGRRAECLREWLLALPQGLAGLYERCVGQSLGGMDERQVQLVRQREGKGTGTGVSPCRKLHELLYNILLGRWLKALPYQFTL